MTRWIAAVALAGGVMAAEPAREGHADLPGVRLWFTDTGGDGIPVVLLHAATGSTRSWDLQRPALAAAGYRVIAFDRRGWGRSIADPASAIGTAADDLQALLQYLHVDRFHLVGTAAGGFVAFDYALSFPDRLRSVVVANSIGGVQDEDYLALGRALRPAAFDALPAELRELGPSYRAANPEGVQRWIELERASRPGDARPAAQPMRNRITFAALESIRTPALLMTGDADMYEPPAIMRLFAARIRHAETLVVAESGHSAYWEQPEIFNRRLVEFLAKH